MANRLITLDEMVKKLAPSLNKLRRQVPEGFYVQMGGLTHFVPGIPRKVRQKSDKCDAGS